jgi:hypothetical protein
MGLAIDRISASDFCDSSIRCVFRLKSFLSLFIISATAALPVFVLPPLLTSNFSAINRKANSTAIFARFQTAVNNWQHYIALVQRKPGALRNGAPFADMPAPLQRLRQGLMRHEGGDKTMAQVLNCVSSHGLEAVLVAVELVIESGALSTEHVLNVLARLNAVPVPESVESGLHLREVPVANTGRYDSLRSDAMVEVNHAS